MAVLNLFNCNLAENSSNNQELEYVAPETFSNRELPSLASDMFSFGMFLYELMTGRPPWHETDYDKIPELVCTNGILFYFFQ